MASNNHKKCYIDIIEAFKTPLACLAATASELSLVSLIVNPIHWKTVKRDLCAKKVQVMVRESVATTISSSENNIKA